MPFRCVFVYLYLVKQFAIFYATSPISFHSPIFHYPVTKKLYYQSLAETYSADSSKNLLHFCVSGTGVDSLLPSPVSLLARVCWTSPTRPSQCPVASSGTPTSSRLHSTTLTFAVRQTPTPYKIPATERKIHTLLR